TVDCIIKDYGNHVKKKTCKIYNGVDITIYKERTKVTYGKMVVASHLRESKGIQDLIEAVHMLSSKHKDQLRIDVFGEGPMEVELRSKVTSYNLEGQIKFKGSSSKLPEQLQQYSFLLQP